MEMDDSLETNNMPLLAIGRQGYGLVSGDPEYQVSSSSHCPSLSMGNNGSFKKSRVDEGEFRHGSNPCGHDPWRTNACEPSQVQQLPGVQRPKRQNCTSLMSTQWDAQHGISGTMDEGSSRLSLDVEGSLGQSSRPCFTGFSSAANQGLLKPSFDFCRSGPAQSGSSNSCFLSCWTPAGPSNGEIVSTTGNNLEEDNVGGWSGVAGLQSLGVRQGDACSSMARHSDGSSLEDRQSGDLMAKMSENEMGTNFSVDFQSTSFHKYNGSADGTLFRRASLNHDASGAEGNCNLDPLLSTYPSSLTGPEGEKAPLPTGGLVGSSSENSGARLGHPHSGRRGSCKRKSSTAGLTGSLSFRTPHSSGRRESGFGRLVSGAGSNRLDIGNPNCAAAVSADTLYTTNTASVAHMWEDPHNPRGTLIGSENDNIPESLRGNTETNLPFSGIHEASQRSVHLRSLNVQPEQTLSQLHAPFTRSLRRSLPISQPHTWSRRVSSAEQPMESVANGNGSNTAMRETDHWSASVISQRAANHSIAGSWGRNHLYSRGNNHHTGVIATPRVPSLFEGSRTRNLSAGSASWLGAAAIDSRLISQMGLDPTNRAFAASTTRAGSGSENHSRAYQAGPSSLIYPSSAASQPHHSTLASAGRNRGIFQGNMIPPSTSSSGTHHFIPGSMEAVPSAAIYQGPYPSAMRPSLFVDGHGESILVSPIQSLLGMPFRGLHILPTEGENRHRVFSEILSALERARRNDELSLEELVMLDPSVVFGGIDILDQHSDMRLDVDNMSYEELLALEERIGNVSTGLSEETIVKCLRTSKYICLDAAVTTISQESEVKCSICQEEYVQEDELGRLECGHNYHIPCIKQWLTQKNQCPICKAAAYIKP